MGLQQGDVGGFRVGIGIFSSAMRWSAEPLGELRALSRAVEQLGFDFVAFPQHLSVPPESVAALGRNWRDPLALSAVALASTTRLRAVTTIVVAPLYSEALLRQAATTLTWLGQGRFELGLGAGYLRADFTDDEQFAARFRLLRERATQLREHAPSLPLWIGGGSGRAAALARRLGATWAPSTADGALVQTEIDAGSSAVPTTEWIDAEQSSPEIERWRATGARGILLRLNARTPAALAEAATLCARELSPEQSAAIVPYQHAKEG